MKRVSEDGIKMLVDFEGEVLKVYKDPVGLPTVGVGHLVLGTEKKDYPVGKKITREESRALLRKDLKRFEDAVNKLVKVPITQNQFDALVSLAFNIGEGGFKRSSVLRHLNNRKFEAAADAFLAWNKAGGKVLPGLVRRRATERSVFLTPDEGSAAVASPDSDTPDGHPARDEQKDTQVNPGGITPAAQPPIQRKGFFKALKIKILALVTGIGGADQATLYAQNAKSLGLPDTVWTGVFYLAVLVAVGVFAYYVWKWYRTGKLDEEESAGQ